MPQLPDFQSDYLAHVGWREVCYVADLMLTDTVSQWLATQDSVQGIEILALDCIYAESKVMFACGETVPDAKPVKLRRRGLQQMSVRARGEATPQQLSELLDQIQKPLAWLNQLHRKTLSAESFERMPVICYMAANLNGRWVLLQANQALTDFTGVPVEKLIGRDATLEMADLIHPEDRPKLASSYDFTRTASGELTVQYRLRNANDEYIPVTERVHYVDAYRKKLCVSMVWHRELDQIDSQQQFQLFDELQRYTNDLSVETGRAFLDHFVRRVNAMLPVEKIILCSKSHNGWWQTWVNDHKSIAQAPFFFQIESDLLQTASLNTRTALPEGHKLRHLLFSDCQYQSIIPIQYPQESVEACLLLSSRNAIPNIDYIGQLLRLFGIRIVREIKQSIIQDAQIEQNALLARQASQLTGMVTLLGQLDSAEDEFDFLRIVSRDLVRVFGARDINCAYYQDQHWYRSDRMTNADIDPAAGQRLLEDTRLITQLEIARSEHRLVLHKLDNTLLWPVDNTESGYLVFMLKLGVDAPDMELLNFAQNALHLAHKGLTQKASFRHQAMRDSLTGLGNRSQLHVWMNERLPDLEQAGLLLFDLNRFKEINDSFGHQFGDKLLREIGPRISSCLDDVEHYLARLGGDEFSLFLPDVDDIQANSIAEKVRQALAESYLIDDLRFQVEASVGVALFPLHGEDGHELLRCADVAMYYAKHSGRNVQQFVDELDNNTPLRIAVLSGLDEALETGQIWVVYQPLMATETGTVSGFEALVRWTHPVYGELHPAEFISIAEMGEGIRKITDFVLHSSLHYLQHWRQLKPDLQVAVNISPQVLLDHKFPDNMRHTLELFDLPGEAIILELTESTLLVDPLRAIEIINVLGEMGIKVEIDDFGTGYSSLSYLKSLPISALKIDRSFVCDILDDPHNEVIVASTIQMAHSLGLKTVAEGVEDEATLLKMMRMGCDMIQGYYYSKPIPGPKVQSWLGRNL